jgi:hypothetical protein
VTWNDEPLSLILRPVDYVASISRSGIEIVDWKSARLIQKLKLADASARIRVLCSRPDGMIVVAVDARGGKGGTTVVGLTENK